MSVIIDVEIPAGKFELGRIFRLASDTTVVLETMVPLGERAVPFFSVHNDGRESFEEDIRQHPSVTSLRRMSSNDEKTVYALDWKVSRDLVFEGMGETGAQLMSATGTATTWRFEMQFSDHESLSAFQEWCNNADIPLEVLRVYNPTKPGSGPWYGLSKPQRDALIQAVEGGYYSIPREISTKDLAEEFDISDQAVTERLRRAIITLVENTLILAEKESKEAESKH
jgi:predicted DNA binding protein